MPEMATPSTILTTPLAALHAAAGAKMGVWFACAMADNFGDEAAELPLCARHCRADRQELPRLPRIHRARPRPISQRILTNKHQRPRVGHGAISLLLNPQGHILAEIETYVFADRLLCVSYAMIRERLIEWLDKYIIMDDVILTDETSRYGTLALEGPKLPPSRWSSPAWTSPSLTTSPATMALSAQFPAVFEALARRSPWRRILC